MMFRARRYRVFLVFATIFVLAFIHFARSREQSPSPIDRHPASFSPNSPAADTVDHQDSAPIAPPPSPPTPDLSSEQHSTEEVQDPTIETPADIRPSPSAEAPKPSSDAAVNEDEEESQSAPLRSKLGVQKQEALEVETPEATWPHPHWKKLPEHYPVASEDLIRLPTGQPKELPKLQADFKDESSADKMQRVQRLSAIKTTFERAWTGYKTSAMGHDEVRPLRGGYRDPFNGWGATLVDSLDTLWLMELKEEFSLAVDYIKTIDFTTTKKKEIPLFETVIRYLGGLLSAYDISGHKYDVLLEKAVELAEVLMGAFDTPNRMPGLFHRWAPVSMALPRRADKKAALAELGSLSVEFTRLAQLTKEDKYYDAIARVTNELEKFQDNTQLPGLWPLRIDASGCRKSQTHVDHEAPRGQSPAETPSSSAQSKPSSTMKALPTDAQSYEEFLEPRDSRSLHDDAQPAGYGGVSAQPYPNSESEYRASFEQQSPEAQCREGLTAFTGESEKYGLGALADSTYEYLPKEYMLLGGQNEQYRTMYEKAITAARERLVFQPMVKNNRDIRFLSTVSMPKDHGHVRTTYDGDHLSCFAGGMVAVGAKIFGIESDMELAHQLTDACVWAYESTKSGIMPEHFSLVPCKKGESCEWNETAYYKALDPNMQERLARAMARKEERRKKKEKEEALADAEGSGSKKKNSIGKRERGNWHVVANSDGKSAKKDEAEAEAENEDSDEDEKIPSHEEFATARIRNERLPPGITMLVNRKYLLRPEAIESVFIMFRLTGDEYWREKGWEMFEAVSKYTRTELANSEIDDVTVETPTMLDEMQSFWLAETLKYFYLLFSDPGVLSLDEYVLNTEAHPLRRPQY
ncbi:seven-hairpin glycosidase [Aspergillus heteromorphus CBS 117.55]|uniref:alpha-1,2-Mannosidase n=1 Tax=Aspergillus heteromorphus CBS 117.55 TaxID=1448321 RepID=A0A317WUE1_9EURO|nr:seven-hairpin glycosidase [Aspergillus heteromorphus CBS 117.55]PWY88478.1 seven-hairpin glycosidase [Aspergillus heteromorphus CBS 117.55]